ncbi:hypothetical protein [Sphingomonas sp.]|uniref:hypothetical protein n=1 Tax=Sphingomonas sp. TaxID=28214 RepID=UPI003D6CC2FC
MKKSIFLGGMVASFALSIATPVYAGADKSAFSIKTPIEKIAANPAAKAVIEHELPGFMTHPLYEQFKTMSLEALEAMFPDAVPHERVEAVDAALKAIPADAAAQTASTTATGAAAADPATTSTAAPPPATAPAPTPSPAPATTPQ